MSKIGKLPIAIPAGVTVTVAPGLVTVKGAKGRLIHRQPSFLLLFYQLLHQKMLKR